jgi:hypothetical protein
VLLACGPCNLKKLNQIIDSNRHYFPTTNNTHFTFDVTVGTDYAIVVPSVGLNKTQTIKAQTTITNLFGLDNVDRDDRITDMRWHYRFETYQKSKVVYDSYLKLKKSDPVLAIKLVIESAKTGFWSIWYNQFINEPEVLAALLDTSPNGFPGTAVNCFDPANNYRPIPRNPTNAIDPI